MHSKFSNIQEKSQNGNAGPLAYVPPSDLGTSQERSVRRLATPRGLDAKLLATGTAFLTAVQSIILAFV
jgi:hypothetical protein